MKKSDIYNAVLGCLLDTLKKDESVQYWHQQCVNAGIDLPIERKYGSGMSLKSIFHDVQKRFPNVTWPKCGKQQSFRENRVTPVASTGYVCRSL